MRQSVPAAHHSFPVEGHRSTLGEGATRNRSHLRGGSLGNRTLPDPLGASASRRPQSHTGPSFPCPQDFHRLLQRGAGQRGPRNTCDADRDRGQDAS